MIKYALILFTAFCAGCAAGILAGGAIVAGVTLEKAPVCVREWVREGETIIRRTPSGEYNI